MNDNELIARLQKDDIDAFNDIYWKYHHSLYANILKLLKDPVATQDILQEVFIVLWEKRLTIDPNRPVANWLFVVSYNKSVDYLKTALKQSISYEEINQLMTQVEDKDLNLRETQLILLEKAIDQLSPQRKKVFELCKIQRKSYEEAASELQISKHTIKEYLSSAIVNIKEYLKQHPDSLTFFMHGLLLMYLN